MFRLKGCGLPTLGVVVLISIAITKIRPKLDQHPFSSVITNERSSSRAFGESVSRPDPPAVEEHRKR